MRGKFAKLKWRKLKENELFQILAMNYVNGLQINNFNFGNKSGGLNNLSELRGDGVVIFVGFQKSLHRLSLFWCIGDEDLILVLLMI